jgi:poly-gamma-glutamate capsule biosynthesis protein CapA/YwtB (metallophosphatase superfamily)
MLTRGVGRSIAAARDPSLPFRMIAPLLQSADIAFVNLESPFSDKGKRTQNGLIFNADPANIAGLMLAGVDVASTANNHSRDAGAHGLEFTYKWLEAHGIQAVGSGASASEAHRGVVLERHGVRFGFLAYTYDQQNGNWHDVDDRIANIDIAVMRHDVVRLANQCNVVIVSMHNGIEYQEHPNQNQRSFAHAAIDAGATLVVGHHPHVVQPFEYYRNGLIFYSLGNFVFDQFQRQQTQRGEIAEVRFLDSYIESARVLPLQITHGGPVLITEAEQSEGKEPTPQAGDHQEATPQQ